MSFTEANRRVITDAQLAGVLGPVVRLRHAGISACPMKFMGASIDASGTVVCVQVLKRDTRLDVHVDCGLDAGDFLLQDDDDHLRPVARQSMLAAWTASDETLKAMGERMPDPRQPGPMPTLAERVRKLEDDPEYARRLNEGIEKYMTAGRPWFKLSPTEETQLLREKAPPNELPKPRVVHEFKLDSCYPPRDARVVLLGSGSLVLEVCYGKDSLGGDRWISAREYVASADDCEPETNAQELVAGLVNELARKLL